MIWETLKGHDAQIEMFRRAIQRDRTAHAYLLTGPSGTGKRLFAHLLAQCLFCPNVPDSDLDACGECPSCKQMQAGTHPDLLTVGCPEGKRELPVHLIIGAKENRGREGLCHDLGMRPMSATRRIAVVDDADLMNEESANAFLKTLEEPPAGSLIFMITPDLDPILSTIRSRCQTVRFAPLPDEILTQLLIDEKIVDSVERANAIVPLAEGNLETARQLVDENVHRLRTTVEKTLSQFPINPIRAVSLISEKLDEIGGDSVTQRQNARWALQFAIESLRLSLRRSTEAADADRVGAMIDRCIDAEIHLNQTMPIPLCFEALYDDLSRLSREQLVL